MTREINEEISDFEIISTLMSNGGAILTAESSCDVSCRIASLYGVVQADDAWCVSLSRKIINKKIK